MMDSATPFLAWTVEVCFVALLLSLALAALRLFRGPTVADRVVALDLMSVLGVAVVALHAVRSGQPVYLDAAIALALVGFFGTVAYARYLEFRSGPDSSDEG